MLGVSYAVENIYEKWRDAVSEYVGDNVSMETVQTIAAFPAANLYFMGFPTEDSDLEGNENAVTASVQVDIYAKGQTGLLKAYRIDEASHEALLSMGFRRTYGPQPLTSSDNPVKRLTSRYSVLLT